MVSLRTTNSPPPRFCRGEVKSSKSTAPPSENGRALTPLHDDVFLISENLDPRRPYSSIKKNTYIYIYFFCLFALLLTDFERIFRARQNMLKRGLNASQNGNLETGKNQM